MSKRSIWKLAEIAVALGLMLGALPVLVARGYAQTAPAIATTTVVDTVYRADGTAA